MDSHASLLAGIKGGLGGRNTIGAFILFTTLLVIKHGHFDYCPGTGLL